jgi:hypothetical protein
MSHHIGRMNGLQWIYQESIVIQRRKDDDTRRNRTTEPLCRTTIEFAKSTTTRKMMGALQLTSRRRKRVFVMQHRTMATFALRVACVSQRYKRTARGAFGSVVIRQITKAFRGTGRPLKPTMALIPRGSDRQAQQSYKEGV